MTPQKLVNLWRCTAANTMAGSYANALEDCADQLESCLRAPQSAWHPAGTLPTPGDHPLSLMLETGEVVTGYRREYVASRSAADLGYTDERGQVVKPVMWSYA